MRELSRDSLLPEAFVEFGFSLPGRGPLVTPEQILKLATRADALRYDSVFVTDHIVLPASQARKPVCHPSAPQHREPIPQKEYRLVWGICYRKLTKSAKGLPTASATTRLAI